MSIAAAIPTPFRNDSVENGLDSPSVSLAGLRPQSVHNSHPGMGGQSAVSAVECGGKPHGMRDPILNNIRSESYRPGGKTVNLSAGNRPPAHHNDVIRESRDSGIKPTALAFPSPIKASAGAKAIKSDATIKNDGKAAISKTNKIINSAVRTAALSIAVTAVLIPVAMAVGIPVGALLIVQAVAITIGVLMSVYAAAGPDKFAVMMSKLLPKQTLEVQSVAGAAVGLVSASGYNATLKGKAIAAFAAYHSVKRSARYAPVATGIAGANAAGAAIGTVDTLAKGAASKAMHAGAAAGGVMGGWTLGTVEGSAQVGEMAGVGAFYGAGWGKQLDEYASAVIANPWRIFLKNTCLAGQTEDCPFTELDGQDSLLSGFDDETLNPGMPYSPLANPTAAFMGMDNPGKGEWAAAITGGITGGMFAAADIRAGGNLSRTGMAFGNARDTVSFGKLVRAARNFMDGCLIQPAGGVRGFPCID